MWKFLYTYVNFDWKTDNHKTFGKSSVASDYKKQFQLDIHPNY